MGTYERMCGLHLSLGAKHGIYGKEGFKRNSGKFHIDVMIDTTSFSIDDNVVFDGKKCLVQKRLIYTFNRLTSHRYLDILIL
jgi:hypothetical protein